MSPEQRTHLTALLRDMEKVWSEARDDLTPDPVTIHQWMIELCQILLAAEAAQEPEWMQHIGEVGKPLTVEMLRQTYGENGLAALKDVFPQFFKDEAAQEQHCLSCGGLKGAHLGRCQPFEDLFSAMYRETFGVDRPSATPRAPFTQEYAAQEQPMTMAEFRQTRETGFLVKDL